MTRTPKILIVDDVKAAHQMYKQALIREEYEIFDAERGKEAISILFSQEIDLVVLDLHLPDMSGIDVLKKIREKRPNLPVIILTAFGMKDMVIKTGLLGVDSYLVKPVELNMFRSRIKSVLEKKEEYRLDRLATSSQQLLNEISSLDVDETLAENVQDLKDQIRDIAGKIQTIGKKRITAKKKSEGSKQDIVWTKEATCPVCATKFTTYNFRSKSVPVIMTESDFHEVFEDESPLNFEMWVCPNCLYAAKREDFDGLLRKEIEKIARDKLKRKIVSEDMDFKKYRDSELGIKSYSLAAMCYISRGYSAGFLGSLYLKAAWTAREMKDSFREKEMLELSVGYFEQAFNAGDKIEGKLTRLGAMYLVGEINRRLKRYKQAADYFMKVKTDPGISNEKAVLRMTEEQFELLKEERAKEEK